jgi:4-hydroxy-3-methylbut-2-en-1-yl diphosphate reductase
MNFPPRIFAMTETRTTEILLANPRGFCAGVERAIGIVERALELHGAPVYVRHEIVRSVHRKSNRRSDGQHLDF